MEFVRRTEGNQLVIKYQRSGQHSKQASYLANDRPRCTS